MLYDWAESELPLTVKLSPHQRPPQESYRRLAAAIIAYAE